MTGPVRRFDPAELSDDPGSLLEAEVVAANAIARDLEAIAEREAAPTAGFNDRVMAAIAAEPTPKPTRVFGSALRAGRFGAAVAAVGDAWRVAFGSGRPFAVRGQALALVLVVLIGVLGLGGGAAVGAARLLTPEVPPPSPTPSVPPPSSTPSIAPTPPPSIEPSPTSTPEASPTDTAEPEGTDDSGGNRGPGGGSGSDDTVSDESGSGSGSNSGSGGRSSGSDDPAPDDSHSGGDG